MDLAGKSVLVVGLARSGVASAQLLHGMGARVLANDIKKREEIKEAVDQLPEGVEIHTGIEADSLVEQSDMIVLSPGVPFDAAFVTKARAMGKEVIGELEFAFRLCNAPVVAITGTNGKTTTTVLTGEIFKAAGKTAHVIGNIGVPFSGEITKIGPGDIAVVEVSSFQLETVSTFRPRVSAIMNITEDHLDRHKTMENYTSLKARIFRNQTQDDWVVLNGDNQITGSLSQLTGARKMLFSRTGKPEGYGAWVEDGLIKIDAGLGEEMVCRADEVFIPGPHNLENALAAAAVTRLMGVSVSHIAQVLKTFRGVEHRIELVEVIDEISFYNDSKGTNPDASIKAIQAMKGPTVLIAGGYDKGSSFEGLVESFGDKIVYLVVLGQTADKIMKTAWDKGFDKVIRVNTLKEGVQKAFCLASPKGNVLLSPACASWDMFKDYEERGRVFKEVVKALKGEK